MTNLNRKPHILVAEDDRDIHPFFRTALTAYGYQVTCVEDGAAAIAALEANPELFQCVLLDLMMPRVNGLQAAVVIHKLCPRVSIILMTCVALSDLPRKIPIAGLLQKPFCLQELEQIIAFHTGVA